jgi:hypothetical protein
MPRRRHGWLEIGGWELGAALRAGELRVFCPRPDCEHVARFDPAGRDPTARLFTIARRMRCRGCARKGAQFEVWARAP